MKKRKNGLKIARIDHWQSQLKGNRAVGVVATESPERPLYLDLFPHRIDDPRLIIGMSWVRLRVPVGLSLSPRL
ncbi:hypothetical protein ACS77P_18230, partial [Yersinia enterocolitica]|uniref:hypothetical protein n=1 Tax=Yersinia enterocolitica TaxID=630 RepID=UPI003F42691D